MTPFSAPGAGATPPAGTPRAQGAPTAAGVPRPMTASYGNLGAPVARIAPSPTPRRQVPPTARKQPGVPVLNPPRAAGAAFPAASARPRVTLAPHAQGPPTAAMPRPIGGAQMTAAPSPPPRMQAGQPMARAPGILPNARAVAPDIQYARPQVSPYLGKRATTTMGPGPGPAAKRHAPIPQPQGAALAPTGGMPLPTNPAAPTFGVRAPAPPGHGQGVHTAGNATTSGPPPPPLPKLTYAGVYNDPSKGWMARVMDPTRRIARSVGPFDDPHQAALAHDRVAVACAGRGIGAGARLNFPTAFYHVETAFLQRWEGDVCDAVEKGEYEETYAKFLGAGYKAAMNVKGEDEADELITDHADEMIARCVGDGEFFWDDIEHFFLYRTEEIGQEALEEKEDGRGRQLLGNRFVEMHRNRSLCAAWRRNNHMEKLKAMMIQNQQQQQQIQMPQQQQQQTQMAQQQQQQIHMQQQQQQIQMLQQQQQQQIHLPEQQQQIQMPQQQQQQIHMQQQQQIQMQQRWQQQHMMIQKQRQQQLMMAQQQEQQYQDDDAAVEAKQELS